MRSQKWRMAVFYYIFYAQTRLEGKYFILLHPSKHWRLAAFSFYQGKNYWRAGDLDQGINLEWPNINKLYTDRNSLQDILIYNVILSHRNDIFTDMYLPSRR